MHNLVGIFRECSTADRAVRELLQAGIPQNRIMFLTGLDSAAQTTTLPTTDAEPEGMGKAVGELVGGVTGASTGLALGSALASLFVPGVGPIMAAYLIGYSGDVRRFPTAGHYARYNATAPIEASSLAQQCSLVQPHPARSRGPRLTERNARTMTAASVPARPQACRPGTATIRTPGSSAPGQTFRRAEARPTVKKGRACAPS